jgi:hypothetical protein
VAIREASELAVDSLYRGGIDKKSRISSAAAHQVTKSNKKLPICFSQ